MGRGFPKKVSGMKIFPEIPESRGFVAWVRRVESRCRCQSVVSPLATASPRNARNPIESVVMVTKIELATAGS